MMENEAERRSLGVDDGGGLVKQYGSSEDCVAIGYADAEVAKNNLGHKELGNELSIEQIFDSKRVPSWWEQMTLRGFLVSLVIGIIYSIIVMKLSLTTGLVPTMNVSAGLLGFVFMRTWTKILKGAGLLKTPFTRQENTVIQTCAVACYSISFAGGFASFLLGMSRLTYEQAEAGTHSEGNIVDTIKEPGLGWMTGYVLLVSFVGILALVPLRKVLIIDYKLTYPSGTATAVLINGFHTPHGDALARKQVHCFGKFFAFSFLWGFFQWFFTGGDNCGFGNFPVFGLRAWKQSFYFDFSTTYVGAGMICPHLVNGSLLLGAIVSWGIMWPLISNHKGDWYSAKLSDGSMQGLQGYKVFICIALILGDGLYNFAKAMYIILPTVYRGWKKRTVSRAANKSNGKATAIPVKKYWRISQIHGHIVSVFLCCQIAGRDVETKAVSYDEQLRDEMFMKDSIPVWIAATGYAVLAGISTGVIPQMFPHMKWYYILLAYAFAPVLAFCNAYGAGLTDQNLAYNYGKVALFLFAAWAGKEGGGVLVGLAACGVLKCILSSASDLMHDFRTGHMTLSSPRSMFLSQLIGTAMGCIVGPLTFWLFYKAFDVGNPQGEYKAPYALIYRNMAILGVDGFSTLPKHCLHICYGFFAFAVVTNIIRDRSPNHISRYIPLPMAMAVPFLVGGYFAIDMFLGTAIVFAWQKMNRKKANMYVPAVASGLICGDGIWILPSSILALTKVQPPICMKFLSRHDNEIVSEFLG